MTSESRSHSRTPFTLRPIAGALSFVKHRYYRGGWLVPFLVSACRRTRCPPESKPLDFIVLTADHFEPSDLFGGGSVPAERVHKWCAEFERIASKHVDSDGQHPQQTWFFRAEYESYSCLNVLSDFAWRGYGEIEFHLHHGFDDHASFSEKLRRGLNFFNSAGAMLTSEAKPRQRFGYVAGNWSLDNGSRDASKSGCNTELIALKEHGCYADFTFPAIGSHAQPRKVNSIYYATDTPAPKSYDTGIDVTVGRQASGDLMIVQGPLTYDFWRGELDDGAVEDYHPPNPKRLEAWKNANVHVCGRPDWIFVKLHCHGMQSKKTFASDELDSTFGAMVQQWGSNPHRLHFVNAREAYNIIRAAEAGQTGNAGQYRDFEIPKPASRYVHSTLPWKLNSFSHELIDVEILEPQSGTIRIRQIDGFESSVTGVVERLRIARRSHGFEWIVQGSKSIELKNRTHSIHFDAGRSIFVPDNGSAPQTS